MLPQRRLDAVQEVEGSRYLGPRISGDDDPDRRIGPRLLLDVDGMSECYCRASYRGA